MYYSHAPLTLNCHYFRCSWWPGGWAPPVPLADLPQVFLNSNSRLLAQQLHFFILWSRYLDIWPHHYHTCGATIVDRLVLFLFSCWWKNETFSFLLYLDIDSRSLFIWIYGDFIQTPPVCTLFVPHIAYQGGRRVGSRFVHHPDHHHPQHQHHHHHHSPQHIFRWWQGRTISTPSSRRTQSRRGRWLTCGRWVCIFPIIIYK